VTSPAITVARQVRWEQKSYWRNPAAAAFTFAFPLMFLVVFIAINGNDTIRYTGGTVKFAQYYVPAILSFGLISACYTNIAIGVVFAREEGVLKRIRGTPMPAGAYLTARVVHAALVGFLLVAITVVFGVIAYHASVPDGAHLGQFILTLLVGAGCFAAIGLAVSGIVPNADAGPPIVNVIIFPLLFLSGVFIAVGNDSPAWVVWVGRIFPVKHLVDAMRDSYLGLPFHWSDLAVLALWAVVGVFIASRTFRWEPSR